MHIALRLLSSSFEFDRLVFSFCWLFHRIDIHIWFRSYIASAINCSYTIGQLAKGLTSEHCEIDSKWVQIRCKCLLWARIQQSDTYGIVSGIHLLNFLKKLLQKPHQFVERKNECYHESGSIHLRMMWTFYKIKPCNYIEDTFKKAAHFSCIHKHYNHV